MALLPVLLFADAVSGRAVFYERDIHAYWLPAMESFVRAVAEGSWPLWDPLTNFGRPLLADPNLQIAYPPTWLNLVLRPGTYYTLFVVAHCSFAAVGAFRLAVAWGLGAPAAAWAGACWMLAGPFLSTTSLFHHFASAAWLAWVMLALEGVLRRPDARSAAWLGAAAAGMALAGSADLCIMAAIASLARAIPAVAPSVRDGRALRLGAALAASTALAALLCAVQWWPTLVLVAQGSRGASGAGASLYWSLHPAGLVDLVVPGLVAEMPLGPQWRAAVFEARGPLLRSIYVGVPALVLCGCALLAGRWPMRWLCAGLAGFFLIAALGRFTPVYPALVGLPVLRLLRFPVKYLVPGALFVSLLSAAGLDALRAEGDAGTRARLRWIAAAAAALALAAAAGAAASGRLSAALQASLDAAHAGDTPGRLRAGFLRIAALSGLSAAAVLLRSAGGRRGMVTATLLAAGAADLLGAARHAVRLGPPELLTHRPPILDAFPRPWERRVYRLQYGLEWLNAQFTRPPAGWDPEWAWALGHIESLTPPIATRFGLAGSFDGDFTGLTPVALSRLTGVVNAARGTPEGVRLLRMASVTDVIGFERTYAGMPPRYERLSVYEEPVRVFDVPDPMPRAYAVSRVRAEASAGQPSVVGAEDFDPRVEVALEPRAGDTLPGAEGGGAARITARRSDALTVAVSARGPSFLVVTEGYDPGWRAWVDGEPAAVRRANAIFRAVAVPAGEHVVEMRYRPRPVAWGAAATALGLALGAVLATRRRA